jgi:hypothetical protein
MPFAVRKVDRVPAQALAAQVGAINCASLDLTCGAPLFSPQLTTGSLCSCHLLQQRASSNVVGIPLRSANAELTPPKHEQRAQRTSTRGDPNTPARQWMEPTQCCMLGDSHNSQDRSHGTHRRIRQGRWWWWRRWAWWPRDWWRSEQDGRVLGVYPHGEPQGEPLPTHKTDGVTSTHTTTRLHMPQPMHSSAAWQARSNRMPF